MIIKIVYDKKESVAGHNEMLIASQLIDCSRVYPLMSDTHWGFMAYDSHDNKITEHKFSLKEKVKAYIMEHGRTIDVLPCK